MREILFKAKRMDNGDWVEGFPYWGEYTGAFILQNKTVKKRNARTGEIKLSDEAVPFPVDGSTVCQYTGLTDKNGAKIFEGDIVNFRTKSYMFTSCNVVWEAANAMWSAEKNDRGYRMSDQFEYLVTGNIHD